MTETCGWAHMTAQQAPGILKTNVIIFYNITGVIVFFFIKLNVAFGKNKTSLKKNF